MKIKLLRVYIAIGVGFAISALSIYVGWLGARGAGAAWPEQWRTQHLLKEIDQAVILYKYRFNALPNSLEQLRPTTNADTGCFLQIYLDQEGGFVDGWKRPLLFSNDGTNVLITSLGRDGKPGGKGIDCDLTNKNPNPEESLLTFGQFLANEGCRGMIISSLVCGALAALLSLLTVRIPNLNRQGLITLGVSLLATIVGTLIVTIMITTLHIPSGH